MWALYGLADVLYFLAYYVARHRHAVIRQQLAKVFPGLTQAERTVIHKRFLKNFCDVLVELVKSLTLAPAEMIARVRIVNLHALRTHLEAGRSVMLVTSHLCNWEWLLQGVVLQIGFPVDAAYKPLHAAGFDRELRQLRCRYGAHLIAAKKLVREVVRRRGQLHAVALHADQMPSSSGRRQWLTFLGRETAFYPGPAEIARLTGYAAFFVPMRRRSRGQYQVDFVPISAAGERLDPQVFTARYAAMVEAMIRENPADWTWVHRRWKASAPA